MNPIAEEQTRQLLVTVEIDSAVAGEPTERVTCAYRDAIDVVERIECTTSIQGDSVRLTAQSQEKLLLIEVEVIVQEGEAIHNFDLTQHD